MINESAPHDAARFFMQLSYELSADDMVVAQKLFWRRRRPALYWSFIVYAAFFFLMALGSLRRGSLGSGMFVLLFGVFLMAYFPLIVPYSARSGWGKLRYLHGATTLTTSNEGLHIANSVGHSFLRWEAFENVLEGPDAWLLFVGPIYFYIVPKRAFASDEERIRFRNELHRAGTVPTSPGAPLAAP